MTTFEQPFLAALQQGDFWLGAVFAMLAGFLTSLSPCVYPLIPVTLSVIGVRKHDSHWHGFVVALVYMSGMVFLYTTLGLVFVYFGWLAGSALQNPWVSGFMAVFFVTMSFSMFGAFEFEVPSALLKKVTHIKGGSYRSTFLMGLVSGVIAAPCTGPVLTVILTMIAKESDWVTGSTMMFMYGFGIGLPFLILGTFSSWVTRLPRSGPWLNLVKDIFGVVILSVGLYYFSLASASFAGFIANIASLGWLSLVIVAVICLAAGALRFSFKSQKNFVFLTRALAVLVLSLSLNGLAEYSVTQTETSSELAWLKVSNEKNAYLDLKQILARAKADSKPVLVDFYADWCVTCKEMDAYVYSNGRVQSALERFVVVKVDVTKETKQLNKIQKEMDVLGLPTVVFVDSKGKVLADPKVWGFVDSDKLLDLLKLVM